MVTRYDRERRCGRFSVEWCGGGVGNRKAFLPFKALLVPPSLLRCYWPEKGTALTSKSSLGWKSPERALTSCLLELEWRRKPDQSPGARKSMQSPHGDDKKEQLMNYQLKVINKVKHLNNLTDTDLLPFHLIWLYFKGGSDEQIMVAKQEGALMRKKVNSPKSVVAGPHMPSAPKHLTIDLQKYIPTSS